MIDLILFVFVLCVFYGGFWCGKTYGSLSNMKAKFGEHVKAWF